MAIASVAISTRLPAPSLPLIAATCTDGVFVLMKRLAPISASDRPATVCARTLCSRRQIVSAARSKVWRPADLDSQAEQALWLAIR